MIKTEKTEFKLRGFQTFNEKEVPLQGYKKSIHGKNNMDLIYYVFGTRVVSGPTKTEDQGCIFLCSSISSDNLKDLHIKDLCLAWLYVPMKYFSLFCSSTYTVDSSHFAKFDLSHIQQYYFSVNAMGKDHTDVSFVLQDIDSFKPQLYSYMYDELCSKITVLQSNTSSVHNTNS